jgi:hypothetical protein
MRPVDPLRWPRRGAIASLLLGAATFGLTWAYVRLRVLHPNPWPTVTLFVALAVAVAVALVGGLWRAVRGPRRLAAAALVLAAAIAPALWGLVGLYASAHWKQRLVPNGLPMNLAKMAATSLMRLEASAAYPNRVEADRLIMYYDRLRDPRRDAEAMDRHLARLEGLLGGPLRAKVLWVRGALPQLGLWRLSVHGIALGSGEGPEDLDSGGRLDRHELAHAALDEFRAYDADPPYFLHEGWAEAQSGADSSVLALRALRQRSDEPSIGIRELAGPAWYHRDAGPVYPLGGAFVDFLLQRGDAARFLRLYNRSREDRFGAVVREVYGVELDALEAEFWAEAGRRVP